MRIALVARVLADIKLNLIEIFFYTFILLSRIILTDIKSFIFKELTS